MGRWRSASVVLAIVAAVALAACGGDDDGGDAKNDEPVTLRIAAQAEVKDATEAVLDEFRKAHPNVTIKASYAPDAQYSTVVRAQLNGSNSPDVLQVYPGTGNAMSAGALAKAGVLEDLSDRPWVDTIEPAYKHEVTFDGKTYFYPWGFGMVGIAYDKATFAKAGVKVPTTWTELLDACRTFRSQGLEPIAVGMKTEWVPQLITYALLPSTLYADSPDFDAEHLEGKGSFADSGWRDAFEKYVELEQADCFNEGFNGTSYEDSLALLANGKAAMNITVSESMAPLREANPKADFAMAPVPATDDPDKNYLGVGLTIGFAVSANSQHKDAAKEFVDFVSTPEMAAKYQEIAGGIAPGPDPKAPEGLEQMLPPIEEQRVAGFPDHFWPKPEVQTTHNAVVQQLFTGQTSIDDALKQMDDAFAS